MRDQTRKAHDSLDLIMRSAGWDTRADYSHFLQLQHAARAPVEAWIAGHAPDELVPPPQSGLIARDLDALGASTLAAPLTFDAADGSSALGIAWAIAGSSLGNRAILSDITKAGHDDWPSAFLSDPAMLAFWKSLRERLQQPAVEADATAAEIGAKAVFAHFEQSVSALLVEQAA